jgi:arsenate reductase-like glutaredoxin family protein
VSGEGARGGGARGSGAADQPEPGSASRPIQVFGTEDSQATRAAVRFFKERRLVIQLVDIRRKPMAAGELRRFVERLGAPALADTDGRAWRDAGLGYMRMSDAELAERLLADQRLLRIPLVRAGDRFAAGRDEAAWKALTAKG